MGKLLLNNEHQKTVNALLHSQLPIFQGLTPGIVADVREDETFGDFREKLYEVYRSIPSLGAGDDFIRHLAQSEEAALRPTLQRAEREASRGFLSRIGVSLGEAAISIGARVLFDAQTGELGWNTAARETIGVFADRVQFGGGRRSPLTAWTKLYRHHRSITGELHPLRQEVGSHPQGEPWAIDDKPSANIRITPGILLFDEPPLPSRENLTGYAEGNYRPCECGSGLKWKFCCQAVGG